MRAVRAALAMRREWELISDGFVKAQEWERQGRLAEAATAYVEAVSADPGDLPAWRALGMLYVRVGREDWARRCFSEALRLVPLDREARKRLAQR